MRRFGFFRRAQNETSLLEAGFDTPFDLALCDTGEHLCVRGRGFGTKISVVLRKIAKILRDGLHGVEGIVEAFEST